MGEKDFFEDDQKQELTENSKVSNGKEETTEEIKEEFKK